MSTRRTFTQRVFPLSSPRSSGPANERGKGPDGSLSHVARRRAALSGADVDGSDALWTDLARVIAAARQRHQVGEVS
jgi:hypothetical protein